MAYTTINKPTDYFNTKLYTGNGSTQSITGVGFQPDWTWIKQRSGSTRSHRLNDSVRGANKQLYSNATDAEGTLTTELTSFDSDGFSLGSQIGVNNSGDTYASWNWLAGGTASSNTDGSITSSVSANTTSGFSIVTFTSPSSASTAYNVGHGLGTTPSLIFKKPTSTTGSWTTHHSSFAANEYIFLDLTDAKATNTLAWGNTLPSSSLFYGNSGWDGTSNDYVAYCFSEVKGYSKFGSYSGNSSNDGTFVYTGFKPAMVIVKCTNAAENWVMWDNKRSPSNVVNDRLFPNLSNAEETSPDICDLVSNGFKFRYGPEGSWNSSGKNYIYMAFAESPTVTSTGTPTTAR